MTDYLQLIAAKTVECLHIGYVIQTCRDCKGSGRVLDSRFDGLRNKCGRCNGQGKHTKHLLILDDDYVLQPDDCMTCEGYCHGTGYTVVRDLAVLLVCITQFGEEAAQEAAFILEKRLLKHARRLRTEPKHADCYLNETALVFWNWLEAEEKVMTDA